VLVSVTSPIWVIALGETLSVKVQVPASPLTSESVPLKV